MVDLGKNMEQTIAIAGLLHDIGKLMQRSEVDVFKLEENKRAFCPSNNGYYSYLHSAYTASFFEDFLNVDDIGNDLLKLAASHHKKNITDYEKIIQEADRLSSAMERVSEDDIFDNEKDAEKRLNDFYKKEWGTYKKDAYKRIRIQSIFDEIEFKEETKNINKVELKELIYSNLNSIFPQNIEEIKPKEGEILNYKELWQKFESELNDIKEIKKIDILYNQLYYLLLKYTSNIPSSTIDYPDISLFDHLRTTSAIATVMNKNREKFILLEGDISGIQNFIFKITDGEDKAGVSKKLRGRSFYVTMLTEVISRYIINQLNLTIANILYCGGGKFQLLLPATEETKNIIKNTEKDFNSWLIEKFDGVISCVFEYIEKDMETIKKYGDLVYEIGQKIDLKKKRKFKSLIMQEQNFFINKNEMNKKINICSSCGSKISEREKEEEKICEMCKLHSKIGEKLIKIEGLIFSMGNIEEINNELNFEFDKFGTVYIISELKNEKYILKNSKVKDILKINSEKLDIVKGFKFMANSVARFTQNIEIEKEIYYKNSPLSFEILSRLSEGEKKLGILKMDVDNLGMVFAMGFKEKKNKNEEKEEIKSISRISTLSRNMDIFFSGYLNTICEKLFLVWKEKNKKTEDKEIKELYEKIAGIFYITYAGGDDVFIVGPWDEIIKLGKEIRNELKKFVGGNKNIDISAGIAIVKPKFPIFKGAEIAEEALKKSKDRGRGKITVFDVSVEWNRLEKLIEKSEEYIEFIRNNRISRSLIYYIYLLNKKYATEENKEPNPEYIPKIVYKIFRTVEDKKIAEKIYKDMTEYFIDMNFIGSYVLKKTRGGN